MDDDFLKPETLDRAYQLARKAVQLDTNLPMARAQLGMVLTFKRRHDEAIAEFERAQALNPNFNDWRFANTLVYAGDASRASSLPIALVRLDPFYLPLAAGFLGLANYMLKQYEAASLPSLSRWSVAAASISSPVACRSLRPTRSNRKCTRGGRRCLADPARLHNPRYGEALRPVQASRGRRASVRRLAQGWVAGGITACGCRDPT